MSKLAPFPGFVDKMGYDADVQDYVEACVSSLARKRGWVKYKPPAVERVNTYDEDVTGWLGFSNRKFLLATIPQLDDAEIYRQGVLIPEGTASVCRMIARKVETEGYEEFAAKLPLKLFYTIRCFRNEPEISDTKLIEFGQIGFEYIGSPEIEADIDTIKVAYDSLREIGVPDVMVVRVGDVNIFRALSRDMKNPKEKYEIQNMLDSLSRAQAECTEREEQKRELSRRLSPYCSDRVIETLLNEKGGQDLTVYLSNLLGIDICAAQVLAGLGENAYFDPTVTRGWAYYTGPVFQIDAPEMPEIAGGGRYDTLIGSFLKKQGVEQCAVPATGFAFGTERLEKLFKKYNTLKERKITFSTKT